WHAMDANSAPGTASTTGTSTRGATAGVGVVRRMAEAGAGREGTADSVAANTAGPRAVAGTTSSRATARTEAIRPAATGRVGCTVPGRASGGGVARAAGGIANT